MPGNYSHFYSNLYWGQLKDNCLTSCITNEGMGTKNLLQSEKACARNCMVHAFNLRRNIDSFAKKQKANIFFKFDQTIVNKI